VITDVRAVIPVRPRNAPVSCLGDRDRVLQRMKAPPNHALQQTAASARALAVPSSLRSLAAAEGQRWAHEGPLTKGVYNARAIEHFARGG
jgi:hypothetical protein